MCEKVSTLEELKEKFLLVKQSQHTGELAMRDDRNCLADFLKVLDRKNYTYTGMRDYAIIVLMLDTGIRTREPLNLHNSDFDAKAGCVAVSKLVAKTRKTRTVYLSATTVRLIADFQEIKPQA